MINARHSICNIISNKEIMPGVSLMWIEAPDIAASAKPGQFIMIQCGDDTLLRRPISIHRIDGSKLAVLYAKLGRGTLWLSKQKENALIDVLGPLGNGYVIGDDTENLLLVAGEWVLSRLCF